MILAKIFQCYFKKLWLVTKRPSTKRIGLIAAVVCVMTVWSCSSVFASLEGESINLDENQNMYSLGRHLDIYFDNSRKMTINDIRSPELKKQFKKNKTEIPSFGYIDSVVWGRVSFYNSTDHVQTWFLEIAKFNIQKIALYIEESNERLTEQYGGGNQPFSKRKIKYHHTTFKIRINPESKVTLYLQTWSEVSHSIPLYLWSPEAFAGKIADELFVLGIFYGVFIVMILYNLFVYFSLKNTTYLYYVVYLLCALLYMLGIDGLALQYLIPNDPWFVYRGALFFSGLAMAAATFFCQSFVQSKKYLPKFNLFLTGQGIFFLIVSVLPFFLPLHLSSRFLTSINMVTPAILLTVGILSWHKGFSGARYFVLAWTINIIGIIIHASRLAGILPDMFITGNALRVGMTTEMILLSFALADYINSMRQKVIEAQHEKLKIQQAFTEKLEIEVLERTKELSIANEELDRLSNIDGLTQLFNRRYFDKKILEEWRRMQRVRQPLALIMCDIDYFKDYNDTYGHQMGDDCLRTIAGILKRHSRRASDIAARYGGEEFVVLLPHCTVEEVRQVAESIRAEVETSKIPHTASHIKDIVSLSLGVSAIVPPKSGDPAILVSLADKALYDSKNEGRDRVSVYLVKQD